MRSARTQRPWIFGILSAALAGCGPEAPVASLEVPGGPFAAGDLVTIDGSGSSDPNDPALPLVWAWRLVSSPPGSRADLLNVDQPATSIFPDVYGDYEVGLVLDNGAAIGEGTVTFTVDACGNEAPTISALAADPPAPDAGTDVRLSAVAQDPDEACGRPGVRSFAWRLASAPAGSGAVLSDPTATDPWIHVDLPGTYTAELIVTDDSGRASEPLSFDIQAGTCGVGTPIVSSVGVLPAAPNVGDLVTLSVSASDPDAETCGLDPDLVVVSTLIGAPPGSAVGLTPAVGLEPAFIADMAGDYVIRTVVTDGTGRSSSVDTPVTVDACGGYPPVARVEVLAPIPAGPGTAILASGAVTGLGVALDASASTDDDAEVCGLEQTLAYAWSFYSKPSGSHADLNDASLSNPSFTPDVSGTYVLRVVVSDGTSSSEAWVNLDADATNTIWVDPSYNLDYVDGGTTLWDSPRGIAVDGSGNIYVVQTDISAVTITSPAGFTSLLSLGGYLNDIQDIAYDPTSDALYVSSRGFDEVIRLDMNGFQTPYTNGGLDGPNGVSIEGSTLAVADEGADRIRFYDLANPPGSNSTGSDDFGGNLENPWGVLAYGSGSFAAVSMFGGELWRTASGNDARLTDSLDEPRGVVRGTSGAFYVADRGSRWIVRVEDCGGFGGCDVTPIAWGLWEPYGLEFADSTTLLVTDREGGALYEMTGTF